MADEFLARFARRGYSLPDSHGFHPAGLALGEGGSYALEVAIATCAGRPAAADLRAAWKARVNGRPTPVLLVAIYDGKAAICGPAGEHPLCLTDLDLAHAERMCAAAQEEPDYHAALRFLHAALPAIGSPLPGIRNEGFFASHYLAADVPGRQDWAAAGAQGRGLTWLRDKPLLEALGFRLEALPGPVSVLRAAETRVALALLLQRGEEPDTSSQRFSGLSPISYALAAAEREGVEYVLACAGPALRLYPVRPGTGVAQRGRAETFFEIRMDLLPEAGAGYLWLVFSAAALAPGRHG
jgi:hypothetical protein